MDNFNNFNDHTFVVPHSLSLANTVHWATDKPERKREAREAFSTLLPTLAERTSHAALRHKPAELPVTWCRLMPTLVESDELDQAEITRRTSKETVTVVEQKEYIKNDPCGCYMVFQISSIMRLSGNL